MDINTNMKLIKRTNGNPGALEFITILIKSLVSPSVGPKGLKVIAVIQEIPELSGEDLAVLWDILGKKDINRIYDICCKVPYSAIIHSSSKRDDSGVDIINNYL
jgi:hypothetical protein